MERSRSGCRLFVRQFDVQAHGPAFGEGRALVGGFHDARSAAVMTVRLFSASLWQALRCLVVTVGLVRARRAEIVTAG